MAIDQRRSKSHATKSSARSTGRVWLDNRYKAWYWVAGFIVVVAVLILLAY